MMTVPEVDDGLLVATKFGLKFAPPTIMCEYQDIKGKKRTRTVKLQELGADSDVDRLCKKVVRCLPRRLDTKSFSKEQIKRLLRKLQSHKDKEAGVANAAAGGGAGRGAGVGAAVAAAAGAGTGSGGLRVGVPGQGWGEGGGEGGDEDDEDLNKVSPEALVDIKAQMDVEFNKHRKLPGHADFVYDVEVDFEGPTEDNDWDDDDDDDGFVESDDDVFG